MPGNFDLTPGVMVPEGLWAASCSVWPPSWEKELFSLANRNVSFPNCVCFFLSYCYVNLERVRLLFFCSLPHGNWIDNEVFLIAALFPDWTSLIWPLFVLCVPAPWPSWCLSAVLRSALFWWAQNQTHSPGAVLPVLKGGVRGGQFPQPA